MMTNRSDRGSAKPRGSQRFERDDVIREPACGLHQGQQPCGAARTGRTHGCTRLVLIAKQKLLRRRGRPHMDLQRPHHCTTTLVQGPSTPSRQSCCRPGLGRPLRFALSRSHVRLYFQHRNDRRHGRARQEIAAALFLFGLAPWAMHHSKIYSSPIDGK